MAAKCKNCGAPLIWIHTKAGMDMACNAAETYYKQTKGGKNRIVTPTGEVLQCVLLDDENDDLSQATGYGHVPHWSTCPNSDRNRKKGDRP